MHVAGSRHAWEPLEFRRFKVSALPFEPVRRPLAANRSDRSNHSPGGGAARKS